jgi:hypothetical protein
MAKVFEGKTTTAIKTAIRETAFSDLITAFSEIYGADNVSIVGNSEIAVGCGIVKDKDGFEHECVFTVKPVVKDYEDRKTATKTIKAYDRLDEAEAYEAEKSEKEKKAEEKAKARAEKNARDEKARAEKKAKAAE